MANQRALPPSLLLSFDSKLVARKAVFGLFFKAAKCVVGQAIRAFPNVSLVSECIGLFWLTIKKVMDSTQLILICGKSTMVLSIRSCTQFLMLKVAVTLTLTLITEIGVMLRGVILYLCSSKHTVLQAVLLFFCPKNNED